MTIYSDTTDYSDYGDYTDYSSDLGGYDDPAESTSCCCGTSEAPIFDEEWGSEETGSVWGESSASAVIPAGQPGGPEVWSEPSASAVIPAGQPGGPEIVSSAAAVMPAGQPGTTTDWQPVEDASGLYPDHVTIGGYSPYGTVVESPTGAPIFDGGGFSSYGTAHPTLTELVNSWGTGPAQPTGPVFEPTTMYINNQPTALAQIYGVAANNGDIMSQLLVRDIMISQANMARVWTI